jgi:YHS domain-containing protein
MRGVRQRRFRTDRGNVSKREFNAVVVTAYFQFLNQGDFTMSRKLSTLAIALFGFVASSLMAAGQDVRWQHPGPQNDLLVVTADEAGPLAAAKQTDKELIEKQKICPVTDAPLGSMGAPVKVVVKGRTVFLCCAGCKKKLLADPDKYIKKIDERK